MFFHVLLVRARLGRYHLFRTFFNYSGSRDREPEQESQRRTADRRCLSFGIIREFRIPRTAGKRDKLSRPLDNTLRQILRGRDPASMKERSTFRL